MKGILVQWDEAAQKYASDQEQSEYAETNKHSVKKRFQDLTGKKVLDLGCGYGYYTDYFISIGAEVLGVDGSAKMIEIARKKYPHCRFELCDISEKLSFEKESFDLVFCNQVLMDMENIEIVFSECSRILKKNGIFYYSIVHPAFYGGQWLTDERGFKYAKSISAYLKPHSFENKFWGSTKHFHRPLSYYLNVALDHGFILRHVEEPRSYNSKTANEDLPLFFFAEYQKA